MWKNWNRVTPYEEHQKLGYYRIIILYIRAQSVVSETYLAPYRKGKSFPYRLEILLEVKLSDCQDILTNLLQTINVLSWQNEICIFQQ